MKKDIRLKTYNTDFDKLSNHIEQSLDNLDSLDLKNEYLLTCTLEGYLSTLRTLKNKLDFEFKRIYTDVKAAGVKFDYKGHEVIDIVDIYKTKEEDFLNFDLEDINFPLLSLTNHELEIIAINTLLNIAPITLDKDVISNFVKTVRDGYCIVFYHHFTHAFSVMQVSSRFCNF